MDDGHPGKADLDDTRRRRVATDADHEKIEREMDEAFMWNVTRDSEIRRTLKRLRETSPEAPSVERERIIKEITAKYRMLVSAARSSPANDRVMSRAQRQPFSIIATFHCSGVSRTSPRERQTCDC